MLALVTGSSGFIGGNLVVALLARGDTVRCLVRAASPPPAVTDPRLSYRQVDYTRADLGGSADLFAAADVVFHVAGQTNAASAAAFRRANTEPLENLLAALMASGARPHRFVLISSLAAAGPASGIDCPRTEAMPSAPVEPYGMSKRAAELALIAHGDRIPFTIIRPAAVYGPRDRGFLPIFRMARSGVAIYPGVRDHWISLLAVEDLVAGILAASASVHTVGGTFHLAHHEPHDWRAIYHAAAVAAGRPRPFEVNLPMPLVRVAAVAGDLWALATGHAGVLNSNKIALGTPAFWICSSDLAALQFGFQPRTDLQSGMTRTYEWYVRSGWL